MVRRINMPETTNLKGIEQGRANYAFQCANEAKSDAQVVNIRITSYNVCYTKLLRVG